MYACVRIDQRSELIQITDTDAASLISALEVSDAIDHPGAWCKASALPPVTVLARARDGSIRTPLLPRPTGNCHVPTSRILTMLDHWWAEGDAAYNKTNKAAARPTTLAPTERLSVKTLSSQPIGSLCTAGRNPVKPDDEITQLVICGPRMVVPSPRLQSAILAALELPDASRPRRSTDGQGFGCIWRFVFVVRLAGGRAADVKAPLQHGVCLAPIDEVLSLVWPLMN